MSEITKLYENAEVKKQIPKICSSNELYCKECKAHIEDAMPYCQNAKYPQFTAEKQIELIKWACQTRDFAFEGIFINNIYYLSCRHTININTGKYYISNIENEKFEDAIAGLINSLWQDLTPEEKQQIKEILE